MKKLLKSKLVLGVLCTIMGLAAGWVLFGGRTAQTTESATDHTEHHPDGTIYTCAMHPQIRQNSPGLCPICAMELVPVSDLGSAPNMVEMSEEAVALANVQTTAVGYSQVGREVFLQGKVKVDERNISNQVSHLHGRIEKLYVNFTGETVRHGQKLASLYSPELVAAQKELLEAVRTRQTNPILYNAARNKLRQWKLPDEFISEVESSGEVKDAVDIAAHLTGVILKRHVSVGDHVIMGSVLFTLADLSRLWVEFEAYESDLPWLKVGDKVTFTVASLPGRSFTANITFIDPVINPQTRTASVRLEVTNDAGLLKPEMFTEGRVTSAPDVATDHITIPKSAVLWTGTRSVVYVKVKDAMTPTFEFREVTLGPDMGAFVVVESGLDEGEEVVTNGAFKVDAAAQLAGKKSMMNKEAEQMSAGHDH